MTGTTVFHHGAALQWRCLPFHALSAETLYRLLRLRSEVFVVEQACVFLDMDGLDAQCLHVLGEVVDQDGTPHLHASTRLVPPGVAFAEASIGRVVTAGGVFAVGAIVQAAKGDPAVFVRTMCMIAVVPIVGLLLSHWVIETRGQRMPD